MGKARCGGGLWVSPRAQLPAPVRSSTLLLTHSMPLNSPAASPTTAHPRPPAPDGWVIFFYSSYKHPSMGHSASYWGLHLEFLGKHGDPEALQLYPSHHQTQRLPGEPKNCVRVGWLLPCPSPQPCPGQGAGAKGEEGGRAGGCHKSAVNSSSSWNHCIRSLPKACSRKVPESKSIQNSFPSHSHHSRTSLVRNDGELISGCELNGFCKDCQMGA